MIFENFWPLLFLGAVPVIVILYLLKPKGVDRLVSSNLLWKKILKNEQSRTFFEKFVHNILMYLQIAVVALLMIALMSPLIRLDGNGGGRKVILIDTSGSMQHRTGSGKTRMDEALARAKEYIRTSDNTRFSVVTADGLNTQLLAVDIADTEELLRILDKITASDSGGSLASAQGLLDTLAQGSEEEGAPALLVYTDGAGAADFGLLSGFTGKSLYVAGEAAENVANEYTVYTKRADGRYDVMVSVRNYSDGRVNLDVGLYDDTDALMALSQMSLEADETKVCFFEGVDWQGQTLRSELSGINFASGAKDSLQEDDASAAVKNRGNLVKGLLLGYGNTFLEKAYLAVTGTDIAKLSGDMSAMEEAESNSSMSANKEAYDDYNVVICDAGTMPPEGANCLAFGDAAGDCAGTLENIMLSMKKCDLTAGLSDFSVGVNQAYYFDVPEGAKSFLEYDGKCVGYYGEVNGRKEVVVGFDIRESDFPLRAEFPVFLANAMIYLSDTSWLSSNTYYAGEEITLQPWAEQGCLLESRPKKAGVYSIGNENYQEAYVVRFATMQESDARAVAEEVSGTDGFTMQKVKRTIRNVFIALAILLLIAEWIVYVRQMRYRGKFYPAVRGVLLLCLILALFGVGIRIGTNKTATVFVVDLSNSNADHLEEMQEYLRQTVAKMPAGNVYGIVSFGKDAQVEQFMTGKKTYGGLMTLPEKTATNFEDALSRAMTLIPQDANGRLVVLTDGRETRGNIQNLAQALTAGKTEFLTILYENRTGDDAYIENVELPAYLHPGDKYAITVSAESNFDTDAVVRVYHGSAQSAAYNVHLNKGSNRFVFYDRVGEDVGGGSMENLKVQIQAQGDSCEENDFYNAYSVVESAPRVLVISGRDTNASGFAQILKTGGCDYSVVSAMNAPRTIDDMLDYKSMILVDTYIGDLPQGFLDNLETYVKDYGCGFVCCGGESSFALGGYRGTVLETVLPVNMQLKTVNEHETMAMVMVIDRSGSMSGSGAGPSNLDVAINAAMVAVDNLQDTDYVGVLTFDDSYKWQVEIRQVDDRDEIKSAIGEINSGGGTTIKPSLQEAYEEISKCDVSVRHVVLLTDGMGETDNFSDVISKYTKGGVTLSTVAVGTGSDTSLLEELAKRCGGRYYYSDQASELPRIFAQEVFLGGDSYLQNGEFTLAVRSGHELTANLFDSGWPMLHGYISASEKTASNRIISVPEKDAPILTVWQYGLGRTVAWNTDVTGQWTDTFAGAEDYVQLWKRVVDYSTGNANLGGDSVNVVTAGETTRIAYQTMEYSSSTEVCATVIDPDGESSEVKLHATAPGKYETEIASADPGMYHLNVRRLEDGQIAGYLTTAAAVQFSDEYKFDVSEAPYLNFVQRVGRVIDEEEEIWTKLDSGARERRTLTNLLLGLAICIFLADIAMRRFQYEPDFAKIAKRGMRRRAQKAAYRQAENAQTSTGAAQVPGAGQNMAGGQGAGQMTVGAVHVPGAGQTMAGPAPRKILDRRSRKAKPQEQILDTSQLLKKKDDRNI